MKGLGSSPFARRYLGNLVLISSPPGTEMVQFPGSSSLHLCVQCRVAHRQMRRVTPFGYPRISGCVLLPAASRSLPRPSSYSSSQASTMDPFSLDHILSCPVTVPRDICPPRALRGSLSSRSPIVLRPHDARNVRASVLPVPVDEPARLFSSSLPSSCQRTNEPPRGGDPNATSRWRPAATRAARGPG